MPIDLGLSGLDELPLVFGDVELEAVQLLRVLYLPRLHPSASQLEQPALTVGVEEGVGQVMAVVLRDLEGFTADALLQVSQQVSVHGKMLRLQRQQHWGKASIIRSIFCIFPSSRKLQRTHLKSLHQFEVYELMEIHEGMQWPNIELFPLAQVVTDGCFVEPLTLVEKVGDVLGHVLQQLVLHQELDPIFGVRV